MPKQQQQEGRSRLLSNRGGQGAVESRSSRGGQTPANKHRHRGAQPDGNEDWASQQFSHRQYGSGGSGGSGLSQGLRDASADQSADGDNESSSSSSDEDEAQEGGTLEGGNGTKWRRKGPGPGYQRKAERHSEQFGSGPRSPRGQSSSILGGVGGGVGTGRGGTTAMGRSRSSSSSSNTPHAAIPSLSGMTSRQRSRVDSALPYVEDDESISPSLDMSLSTAYQGSTYNQAGSQRSLSLLQWNRHSPSSSMPNSAQNSGNNSPTAILTPLSQSPASSRSDLRQMARAHAQAQQHQQQQQHRSSFPARRLLD